MRTVKNMVEHLLTFPLDARVYAYEGEETALVVVAKNGEQLGHITASANDRVEDAPLPRRPAGRAYGDLNSPVCTCSNILPWDSNFCPRHG